MIVNQAVKGIKHPMNQIFALNYQNEVILEATNLEELKLLAKQKTGKAKLKQHRMKFKETKIAWIPDANTVLNLEFITRLDGKKLIVITEWLNHDKVIAIGNEREIEILIKLHQNNRKNTLAYYDEYTKTCQQICS